MELPAPHVHPTAIVEPSASLGLATNVWHFCHVREGAVLEPFVSLARDVYVDRDVTIGRGTRVQNGVSIYRGVRLGEWCFVGPHVIFTNDLYPRAGKTKWDLVETRLASGAAIGAGSIVICGVNIGAFAMVGAGALVTKDIPAFTLVRGMPAEPSARICACGSKRLPLEELPRTEFLVGECCRRSLEPEVIALAEKAAEAITGHG